MLKSITDTVPVLFHGSWLSVLNACLNRCAWVVLKPALSHLVQTYRLASEASDGSGGSAVVRTVRSVAEHFVASHKGMALGFWAPRNLVDRLAVLFISFIHERTHVPLCLHPPFCRFRGQRQGQSLFSASIPFCRYRGRRQGRTCKAGRCRCLSQADCCRQHQLAGASGAAPLPGAQSQR